MNHKPNPYHLTAAGIIAALLLLAGRSDMGAPLWQTLLGLLACGAVTAVALGVYHLDEVDKRHREQQQRRKEHEAHELPGAADKHHANAAATSR